MEQIYVHDYKSGGPKSYSSYRVAWSADPSIPASCVDMRTRHCREAACGAEIVRGASARDCALARAHAALAKALVS